MFLTHADLDWFFRPNAADKVARYPLTNLGFDESDVLHIEVAMAGFNKNDVEMELVGNQLYIRGSKDPKNEEDKPKINYIQKHISSNNFVRTIVLHENYVGGEIDAAMNNGILSVKVYPKVHAKKLIQIHDIE